MRDTDYTSLRREFLGVGLTGAMVGLAGCSDSVTIETGSDDEDDESTETPDIDTAGFSFSYDEAAKQAQIEFTGGAAIMAGNLQIQQDNNKEIIWSELGSTTAGLDEQLEVGDTAELGPNVLNWDGPIEPDDTIRLIYIGKETPATLERYTPPESTNTTTTVPASIEKFRLETQSDQQLRVSFTSTTRLETLKINISGAESQSLTIIDFTEDQTGSEVYLYETTTQVSSGGSYTATVTEAVDQNGNDSTSGQAISDTTSLDTSEEDATPPSTEAFSIANPESQRLRVSFDSSEQLSAIQVNITGAESISLTKSDFTVSEVNSDRYTYEATTETDATGDFTATLNQATDMNDNDGANNQSVSVTIEESTNQELTTVFEDGFEDGEYANDWSIVWQNFGDREPTNEWSITQDNALSGDQSLYLDSDGDPNIVATNDRIIELNKDFELTVEYYTPDSENRGPSVRLLDTDQNGSKGNYIEAEEANFGRVANNNPPFGQNDIFQLFDSEASVASSSINESHQIQIIRNDDTITGYHDGNKIISIQVDDIDWDLTKHYRLALRNSGRWGGNSEIYFDSVKYSADI